MGLEVYGEDVDVLGEESDLHVRGTGIGFTFIKFFCDFCFAFFRDSYDAFTFLFGLDLAPSTPSVKSVNRGTGSM